MAAVLPPMDPDGTRRVGLASRAESANGDTQPASGRRNAIYHVAIDVA